MHDRSTRQLPDLPVESTVLICDEVKGTWPLKADSDFRFVLGLG